MSGRGDHTVRSFCRLCTACCGIIAEVAGEEVVKVRGDRDHPVSGGYTCLKGRSLPTMHHHEERIERPRMRVGGKQQPTTWQACLDDVGQQLRTIIDRHGPESVGIFFGSGVGMDAAGYRMAEALHAAIGTPARFSPLTIDGTAKVLVADLMGGSAAFQARPDYDHASFVMFVGTNPVVSHGHALGMPNPVGTIRELANRAQVWTLDPRRTETARLATHHIAPRPGQDYAVLAFLVREVLREGANADVLQHRSVDSDALADAVAPFTLSKAAMVADVPEDQLSSLLDAVRTAGKVAIQTGTGVTMSASANVTQWLAWALMVITDSMNRRGGAWFHPAFARQLENYKLPISPAAGSFGPGPRSRPETQSFFGEWPCAALADEIEAGNIRAVLNLGGNLVTAFPDTARLVPALQSLDVFATIEIIDNETTALSTHVLPTKDQLERPDVTLWDTLSPRVDAQYTPAVVDAVGDRRSAWWVLAELGSRLGHDLVDPDDTQLTDHGRLASVIADSRCSFDDLMAQGRAEVDYSIPAAWVERHIDRLGGWRLAPRLLVDQLTELSEPDPLVLVPRRQKRRVNSQLAYLGEVVTVLLHPDDAAAADIGDGQPVVVRNERGELTGIAEVNSTIRRGVVSVPHGHETANVNQLTDENQIDVVTGMARYSGLPVSVHPLPGPADANHTFVDAGG